MKRARTEQVVKEDRSFSELGLSPRVVTALQRSGKYEHPTAVQCAALPPFIGGSDMLIRSHTGSGKTLSYLLPVLDGLTRRAERLSREDGTCAVIIAPTRELVVQIVEEASGLVRHGMHWIIPGYLIGGEKKKSEKARLRKGVTLLVATPGRLLDHLKTTQSFNLQKLQYLVFDEADRLLDMGFEQDIRAITQILKDKSRANAVPQTALISATLFDRVMTLASIALKNPHTVNVGHHEDGIAQDGNVLQGALQDAAHVDGEEAGEQQEGGGANERTSALYTGAYDPTQQFETPAALEQHFMVVPAKQRLIALLAFLSWQLGSKGRTMVFCSSCASADFLYEMATAHLKEHRTFYRLHGRMGQLDRVKNFTNFRNKDQVGAVLFCTDAAARGLDFPRVTWIVQYDAPPEPKEYIHRVGRTARMGRDGKALLFLMPAELEYVELLRGHGVSMTEVAIDKIPAADRPINSKDLLTFVEKNSQIANLARIAFSAYVKSYAAHPQATKHIFHPKALHLGHVAQSFALSAPPTAFRKHALQHAKDTFAANKSAAAAGGGGRISKPKSAAEAAGLVGGPRFPSTRNKNVSGKTLSNPYRKAMVNEFDAGF